MGAPDTTRYAIYYAPERDSALAAFGDAWLGRSAETGANVSRPACPGLESAEVEAATAVPAGYGFHGTLKAPFHLREGVSEDQFMDGARDFAGRKGALDVPPLKLTAIGSFLALTPLHESLALDTLAASCVVFFDVFRRAPDSPELKRRLTGGLTPRQRELLKRFGYPFVLEEFRFHLTLTGKVGDESLRDRLFKALTPLVRPLCREPLPVREICVFQQPGPGIGFHILRRFPLCGAG